MKRGIYVYVDDGADPFCAACLLRAYGDAEIDRLEEVDWQAWFESFDERELVFLYQERKSDGEQSNFFQLDNPRS